MTTVVFTDLVGSTGLYERLGDTAASTFVTQLTGVLSQIFLEHTGRVVKLLGDGLFVVFDYDETTSKYYVYLVNDTSTGFTPQFRITKMVAIGGVNSVVNIAEYHGILPMHEFYAVGEMSNADLSDHLSIHLAIPAMQVTFEQALKPQNLFKRIVGEGSTFTTLFQHTDRTCYALPIPLKAKPAANSSTDNDTALPHHAAKANTHKNPPPRAAFIPSRDINELANFSTEIDLHIEKLVARPKDMLEFEMLEKQLRVFDDYVTRAVMLGVSRVYIIHGKGKGRLRDEIHRRLRENMFIISFNDNYHPKYGNGATEVVIK